MIQHSKILDSELHHKIKNAEICFGGNQKLKIYGTLKCSSGKRMKRETGFSFVPKKKLKKTVSDLAGIA
ncbi:hypothetical protein EV142_101168 [Flavobacterium circumlabens]|uniref:Uncharacterized protein n=1 Tax=Flavobacterium circumlabens TaxID=2133765 RepID=A0ABY2B399_9FLAO|nr:hypothetical protein EV142_101168 [Flavobacterium circumlabens]